MCVFRVSWISIYLKTNDIMQKENQSEALKASVFKNFLNGEHIAVCSFEDVVRMIRRGDYAEAISDYRCAAPAMLSSAGGGEVVRSGVRMASNNIPRICFAAEYRRHNGCRRLVRRNGVVLMDIDGLKDFATAVKLRNAAARQLYTLLAFIGANGRSVEILCRVSQIDGGTPVDDDGFCRLMAGGYRRLHYVYSAQLGVSIPLAAPAGDAMCLMSADAGVFYNPHAVTFAVDLEHEAAAFGGSGGNGQDDGESPLPGKTVDEAHRYIFYSCWNAVLDAGLDMADPYSAEQAIMLLARHCRRSGLPEQACIERAARIEALGGDRDLITMLFSQAYSGGIVRANPTACVPFPALTAMKLDNFFNKRYRLRRNVLTGVVEYRPLGSYETGYRPVTQEAINAMAFMAQREGIRVWARDIKERVNSALVDGFDPIAEWLGGLPQWDGRDRLRDFAARVPTGNALWPELFAMWMRSMTAQWMGLDRRHGNALVPLLVGEQGCGKTSFTKMILPPALQPYYNDRVDFRNDRSLMQGLSAFALINIDEFDSYSVRRQPIMKYLISKSEVTAMKAYSSTFTTGRRYASFIATTNNPHPLTDETGSRRFICTKVTGRIDFTSPVDYQQLYAQLASEIRSGAPRFPGEEATRSLMAANRPFMRSTDIDDILQSMFRQPSSEETAQELTATEIAAMVRREHPDLPSRISTVEIGRRLKSAGFQGRHTERGTCYKIKVV